MRRWWVMAGLGEPKCEVVGSGEGARAADREDWDRVK